MTTSVNGTGTGLVKASRPRMVNGCPHFDAVEAVTFFYCPLLPYRVVHVISICADSKKWQTENYRYIPLRFAPRIIFKAFINRWGNVFILYGGFMTALGGFATRNMGRAFNQTDATVLTAFALMVVIGLLLKAVRLALDASDNRIKSILGAHELGTSDPYYWPEDVAESVRERYFGAESARSLTAIAEQAMLQGDRSKAMLCARLAMRRESDYVQARTVFDQIFA
jgi:hypothetical protein